jgi:magnesium chelatase subunit D
VEPNLSGVLLLNLAQDLVAPVANTFVEILRLAEDRPIRRVLLGAGTHDDELWLRPSLRFYEGKFEFANVPGLLVDTDPAAGAVLVVVPDLARLSLAASRAAVQILGADIATVERYGFRARWRPRSRWLAACTESEVGRISPHLLDRFPIRINAAGLRSSLTPVDLVLAELAGEAVSNETIGSLPAAWRATAAARGQTRSVLSEDAAHRVVETIGPGMGSRRLIALGRLARALATLDGRGVADGRYVDAAARLIGLRASSPHATQPAPTEAVDAEVGSENPPHSLPAEKIAQADEPNEDGSDEALTTQALLEAGPVEAFDSIPIDEQEGPRSTDPVDDAKPMREFAPLRTPWQRRVGASSSRGLVIGVRQATSLHDLGLVPTMIEAAKYQNLPSRREQVNQNGTTRLVVIPRDLRSYVRSPEPERLLAILLDHTCRKGWDWQDALAPYLRWAYARRAPACLVEVSNRDASTELQAEKFITRSMLDPRIAPALYRPAGRATPLAHGLELVLEVLRHAFQHQRSSLVEAWLVVVSDGRGNVPLQASLTNRLTSPVAREGIDDALGVAKAIRALDQTRLKCVVIDPAPSPYADLPFALAETLGGVVVAGRVPEAAGNAC